MRFEEVVQGVLVRTRVRGSIAEVELIGIVTPDSLAAVKVAVLCMLEYAGPVVGFLVRFEGATVQCTASELDALFEDGDAAGQAGVPAAMIVSQGQLPLFRQHAWTIAWAGIVRQAFTDVGPALEWLTARAATAAQGIDLSPVK